MNSLKLLLLLTFLLATAACGGGGGTTAGGGATAFAPTDYVHTVTNENRVANATWLENELTFGRSDLILLVTQNRSPNGATAAANRSPVGVLYVNDAGDRAPLGRWMISNLDLAREATMRAGMAFNVSIFEPGPGAFVHSVTSRSGTSNQITHISPSGSALRSSRETYTFVTPRLTLPDGTAAATNRHGVGTYFTGGNWAIYNLNAAAMARRAAFNVVMLSGTSADAFTFNTSTARSTLWSGDTTLSSNAILHVVQLRDTRGGNRSDAALRFGAGSGQWGVVNVDGSLIARWAAFRMLVRRP